MATELFSAALSGTPAITEMMELAKQVEVDFFFTVDGVAALELIPQALDEQDGTWAPVPRDDGTGVIGPAVFTQAFAGSGEGILPVPSRGVALRLSVRDTGGNTPTLVVTGVARRA